MSRLGFAMSWIISAGFVATAVAAPLGPGFTYQGTLSDPQGPLSGSYDLVFTLWDAPGTGNPPTGGQQIGGADSHPATQVNGGVFTVELNAATQFGGTAFNGEARWVQVSVDGTVLGPRQKVTATPYALHALNAPSTSGWWQANGANISNTNSGFVGINRSTTVSGSEVFGIQAPVTVGYGGMYIRTDGEQGWPFYGYRAGANGQSSWTYLDGTTGDWRVNVDGDRMTVTDEGRVGIGTVSPDATLMVEAATTSSGNNTAKFTAPSIGPFASHIHYGTQGNWYIRSADGSGKVILQDTGGNVGVGTTTPGGKLGVLGPDNGTPALSFGLYAATEDPDGYAASFAGDGSFGAGKAMVVWGDSDLLGPVAVGGFGAPAGAKLAVYGKVLCEELEVQLSDDWPDYVFADDYSLMPLEQVDEYVREHKHLPDVPSAAEIETEGIDVGAMQATLLRKVEELTLYVIELNREVTALKKQNTELLGSLGTDEATRTALASPDGGR